MIKYILEESLKVIPVTIYSVNYILTWPQKALSKKNNLKNKACVERGVLL